jgi:hypothetical protein
MKRHRSLTVSSSTPETADLARFIEASVQRTPNWECPVDKSREYEKLCGAPSCCVVTDEPGLQRSAVHLSEHRPGSLRLTNIVPLILYELDIDQYNAVASAFARMLRSQARADKRDLRVSLTKDTIRLDDVVTGKYPARFFRQFLAAHPLSGHPSDVDRLDKFICSVSRFSKKAFELDAFQSLLVEELNWPEEKAHWCRSRVEIGLEVLAAYKRF